MPTSSGHSSIRGTAVSRHTLSRSNSYFCKQSQPLSLFDRLPLELHAEIFSYCLPAYPSITHDESPIHIARVCRTWRSLVASTPRLWSSFEIEVQDSGSDELLDASPFAFKLISRVRLWLERSRNQPLSLRLIHIPTGRIPTQLSALLLALFVREARRWRNIEVVVPSTSLSAVQDLFPDDFPALRSLKLHMSGGGWTLPSPSTPFNMHANFKVPWNQLTELDLRLDPHHLLDLDEYASALVGATNLMVCRVNARCTLQTAAKTRDRLELPALKSLHLILQGGSHAGDLLPPSGYLSAEASLTTFLGLFGGCSLSHLGINWLLDGDWTEQWAAGAQPEFMALLKAQASSLRSLELTYLPLGEEAILQCFAQLPLVEEVDLRFSLADQTHDPVTDRVLHTLTLSPPTIPQHNVVAALGDSAKKKQPSEKNVLLPRLRNLAYPVYRGTLHAAGACQLPSFTDAQHSPQS
ncbi:hypothetical protein BKA70DRAFT_1443016 [Coprinopsis sp. MPI-PUGE-AT-0042]|nr:hypothetical protein BKA70DRAFT_1443016 [Coprinopsis sp. MPI-PUGE-AT-0042]